MKNSLCAHNSLRLQASCDAIDTFDSLDKLRQCLLWSEQFARDALILGYGSNVVLPIFYPGMVLFNRISGVEVVSETDDHVHVAVGAGENWHDFVEYCMQHEWFGLENLALIPGSVGAAPVQNIGAYGVDVSQFLIQCDVYCRSTHNCYQMSSEECRFGYRNSVFKHHRKGQLVILRVHFLLHKMSQSQVTYPSLSRYLDSNQLSHSPRSIFDAVVSIRNKRLPSIDNIGNVGSFFVNPVVSQARFDVLQSQFTCRFDHYVLPDGQVKLFAGQLLRLLGWQAARCGAFSLFEQNALVMTHDGEGNQNDCLRFATLLQESVASVFGIHLAIEPEVVAS